jgi:NTE family protein
MRLSILLILLALLPIELTAQEKPAAQPQDSSGQSQAPVCGGDGFGGAVHRPRIGVALEGGGALGLAHVGVLQWFEEHHIPVDCVAGTSMGGLVGGFYATGMNPEELRRLIAGINWDELLAGGPTYEDLSFRRKEDQQAYPNSLILGLRNGPSIPAGLNAGHQVSLLIDRVTLPYYDLRSFDALPTPFECVATELVSGQPYIFKDGSLAEALRATISIPGAFSPVNDSKRVFVDGGLVNNLPTDVVRQMGADIVIAVHLETRPLEAKDIQSLFGVLQQSVRVVIAENEVKGLSRADAVISVPLSEFGSTEYKKNGPIMQKGYDAANGRSQLLEKFAVDNATWQEYAKGRESRKKTVKPVPQFIRVQGTDALQRADIEHFLRSFVGKPLDTQELGQALTRLTGVGKYDTVGYRITENGGHEGLLIIVQEKTYAPPTIQPAFEADGSESGDANFTLATRLTFLDVAGFRSEWRTDFLFGNTYGVSSELYRPLTPVSNWFFAPRADASDAGFYLFTKNDPVANYRFYRADIGGDLGYALSRSSELRLGYDVGYVNAKLRLGAPGFSPASGRTGSARLHYLIDRTDDPVIPRHGTRVETTFRWFDTYANTKGAFPVLSGEVQYFQPVSPRASIFVAGQGGTTFGYSNPGLPQFFLGGPLKLGAYGQNELFGNQYYLFRAGYLHELFSLPSFVGKKIYAVGSYEVGKMYPPANQPGFPNESKFPNDFAAGMLAETALGPFFIGGSIGDSGHHKWFFQLGRVF